MNCNPRAALFLFFALSKIALAQPPAAQAIRVATFNVEDVRTIELLEPTTPRLRDLASVIQRLRPTIVLLNEIAVDYPGAPDVPPVKAPGLNAQRFADAYLAEPQAPGLRPLNYRAIMLKTNTGMPSGHDLDRSGSVTRDFPEATDRQTKAGRAFGGDCWGFGTYPGQYGMALFVDKRLEVLEDQIRTFRLFPWDYMPRNLMPTIPGETVEGPDGEPVAKPWYEGKAGEVFRLSSKSHWDVPVRLPNGAVVHLLCSHPTPPAFDGPEQRNKRRNHDEIRFWRDYIDNAAYIVDDRSQPRGLKPGSHFVILGDLNADPDEGNSLYNPIENMLLSSPKITDPHPVSDIPVTGLDPDDTARFKLRVDYVLPSNSIGVLRSGVYRKTPGKETADGFPSDHFPVWVDLSVPAPAESD